ncbi:MAG TPA: zf-TFIIB domain-containing protein [Candidatus Limnocylindrales bacterium]|nr:zf-TFIIB domain-containing protein [Candidatus Limnocylindrales bacterium]
MEEKDRLGAKLHDKGRGDEDQYMAQVERERLARLSAGGGVGARACPRDGDSLVTRIEHKVSVDVCPTCHGIWLDNGELETILRNEEEPSVTRWLRVLLGR